MAATSLVTGASSGIGSELAVLLAEPGRTIWLLGRDTGRLEEVAARVRAKGAEARTKSLDLADLEAAERFLRDELGEVDEVYLSAARSVFGEVKDLAAEDWEQIYRVDLLSVAQWVREFHGRMAERGGGRIVIVSSLAGYAGYPTSTPYAAAKSGLLGLFRTMWHEGRAHGIDYHLVSPGYVRTRIYEAAILRGIDHQGVQGMLDDFGFGMMDPEEAARRIVRGVGRGRKEIVFPGYARMLAALATRFPGILPPIHKRMVGLFRRFASPNREVS